MTTLRGLTWDHPRGYQVLEELDRLDRGQAPGAPDRLEIPVSWSRQPLAGFEDRPLRDLARDFDLIVIDHPGVGQAVRDDALIPLDDLVGTPEIAGWRRGAIGRCAESYRWQDRQWAAPIDAAAQVGVVRAGSVDRLPRTWDDAIALAARVPTGLCLGGPHALLMLCALAVAVGTPPAAEADIFLDRDTGERAWVLLQRLYALADRETVDRNPISVLDAMAAGTGPVYCPLLFGYLEYQRPGRFPVPLRAFDAPRGSRGRRGSVLGGTGIAVSRFTAHPAAAAAHVRRAASAGTQQKFNRGGRGQASDAGVWSDHGIDRQVGGFYWATRASVIDAWIRPRFPGFLDFQREASALVRAALAAGTGAGAVLSELNDHYDYVRRVADAGTPR